MTALEHLVHTSLVCNWVLHLAVVHYFLFGFSMVLAGQFLLWMVKATYRYM